MDLEGASSIHQEAHLPICSVSVVLVNMFCGYVLPLHFLTNFYGACFQEEEKKLRSRHSLNICELDTDYYYREVGCCLTHYHSVLCHSVTTTLQMKGWWESDINVWFRFMYSQKWNCAALSFPKQNYTVLSPKFHIHVSVSDLYIPRMSLLILLGRSILGIYKSLTDTWM